MGGILSLAAAGELFRAMPGRLYGKFNHGQFNAKETVFNNSTKKAKKMNLSVKTVIDYYPELVAEISRILRKSAFAYLVTDSNFSNSAEIWSPQDRKTILASYAKLSDKPYKTAIRRINDSFDSSREIYYLDRADLKEIKRLMKNEN